MSERLVECVPNFSEGRDQKKIDAIVQAIRDVPGVAVLHVDPGFETNRTVVTFVGAPEAAAEAACRGAAKAAELIDMAEHKGAHPRQGSTDVCPFIPIAGVSMEDCARLAATVGERIARELNAPVYLYEHAATRPERRSLAFIRQGEYEALADKLARPEWRPDFGPATVNPRVGAITVGAREFLIAYNINLNSRSKAHADDIASELREKGRGKRTGQTTPFYSSGKLVKYVPAQGIFPCGLCDTVAGDLDRLRRHVADAHGRDLDQELGFFGQEPAALAGQTVQKRGLFDFCRAVGWVIPEYGRAQISINLTNYRVTPTHRVLEETRRLAAERGLVVTGSEIVGMVPYAALRETGEFYLRRQGTSRGLPSRDIVETAVQSLGLEDVGVFDREKQILGLPRRSGALVSMRIDAFVDEVSRPSPAPGGGSIAALAGALSAALGAMVANLTHQKPAYTAAHAEAENVAIRCQDLKDALLVLVDDDTAAFNDVLAAGRLPKGNAAETAARDAAMLAGMKKATEVPLRTAERCLEALRACRDIALIGLSASATDAGVGAIMGHAAVLGAAWNVRTNLASIADPAWTEYVRSRVDATLREADALVAETRRVVDAKIEAPK